MKNSYKDFFCKEEVFYNAKINVYISIYISLFTES